VSELRQDVADGFGLLRRLTWQPMPVVLTDEQAHNIAATLRRIADLLAPTAQETEAEDQADDSQWHAAQPHS
jgi:hypothetical protein